MQKNKSPEGDNCYNSILLSTKNKEKINFNIWLEATDNNSNEKFKCKIGFAQLKKLSVNKRFDVINKGHTSELYLVVFSLLYSLLGVR